MRTHHGPRSPARPPVGRWAFAVLALVSALALGAEPADPAPTAEATVAVVRIEGSINPGSADYLLTAIARAASEGHGALVIELDTPGGLLESTRDIVKAMLSAPLPVVVWVTPPGARAGSAGVFITLAGHVAAMAPGTNIGAAHPVSAGGQDPDQQGGEHMAEKVVNDAAAFIESIAEERGRNVAWAIEAVRESASIPASRALELGVVDLLVADLPSLLEAIDGRQVKLAGETRTLQTAGARVVRQQMTTVQRVVNAFADPNIAYMLMMLGMIGLGIELYNPGVLLPGVLGGIALVLAFISFQIVPINIGGLLLIFLGVGLLVAEAFAPSFGVLGIGGIGALVLGSTLLVDEMDPGMLVDQGFGVSWWVIVPLAGVMALALVGLGTLVVRLRSQVSPTGKSGLVGQTARCQTDVGPDGGKVVVAGELWKAVADEPLPKGARVRIVALQGLELTVEPLDRG